jgi:chaperone required for assembly of F1-ATPase
MLKTCEGFPAEPIAMLCCQPSSCQVYTEDQLRDKHILEWNERIDSLACFARYPNPPQPKSTDRGVVVTVVVLSVSAVSLLGLTLAVLAVHRWQQQKALSNFGKQMEMEQQVRLAASQGAVTLAKTDLLSLVGAKHSVSMQPRPR